MPRPLQNKICEASGSGFASRKPASRFCSKSCIWNATKGPEFNRWVARNISAKNGDTQRGRGKGLSYTKFMGRHEHRVVAERTLGRALVKGEVVHHIDGNKKNNHPDNLAVMTQRDHMKEHGYFPGMKLWWEPWKKRWPK